MIAQSNCLGIPVRYDPTAKFIVDSRGLWRWQQIVTGPTFFQLPPREQAAFMLHEAGHCKLGHVRKLGWFIARNPRRLAVFLWLAVCAKSQDEFFAAVANVLPEIAVYRKAQEFQADRFAADCGYGADLIRAFGRIQGEAGPFHPHPSERVLRLARPADLTTAHR